jgi:hypothetical protein
VTIIRRSCSVVPAIRSSLAHPSIVVDERGAQILERFELAEREGDIELALDHGVWR